MTISNDVLSSIKFRLRDLFEGVEIYTNKVEDGTRGPFFVVHNFDTRSVDWLGNDRWTLTKSYSISYVADDNSGTIQDIAENLIIGLKDFKNGDYYLRSENEDLNIDPMDHKSFTYVVDFKIILYKERERAEAMEITKVKPYIDDLPYKKPKDPLMWQTEEEKKKDPDYKNKDDETGLMEDLDLGWRK
mgnify:CR=1 FL=1